MEIHQEHLEKAVQRVKESREKLDLSRSVTDPPFSAEEWKSFIPFITNIPSLRELRLNCKNVDIKA